jgi:hypothetical protein
MTPVELRLSLERERLSRSALTLERIRGFSSVCRHPFLAGFMLFNRRDA